MKHQRQEEDEDEPKQKIKKSKIEPEPQLYDLLLDHVPNVIASIIAEFLDDRLPWLDDVPCPEFVLKHLQSKLNPPLDLVEDILKLGGRIAGCTASSAWIKFEICDFYIYVLSPEDFIRLVRRIDQKATSRVRYNRVGSSTVSIEWKHFPQALYVVYSVYTDLRDMVLSFDFDYEQCIVFSDAQGKPRLGQTSWCKSVLETKKIRFVANHHPTYEWKFRNELNKAFQSGMELIQPFTTIGQLGLKIINGTKASISQKPIKKKRLVKEHVWHRGRCVGSVPLDKALDQLPLAQFVCTDEEDPFHWEFVDLSQLPAPPIGMEINVQTGSGSVFTIEVESTDAILSVKQKIEDECGMPIAMQFLVFASKELEDHQTLANYNIQRGSIVKLFFNPIQDVH